MILYCNCSYSGIIPDETKRAVLDMLSASGRPFAVVPDLCELAARRDPFLKQAADSQNSAIIACFPRAVRWLFHAAGSPLPDSTTILNMRKQTSEEIITRLTESNPAGIVGKVVPDAGEKSGWIPWFPVIDYVRCKNCKQCLGFCLFGVYEPSGDGKVAVKNPRNCKTNCPACARICPEVAIMFPKYADPPVNGAEIENEEIERANVKVNVKEILGEDPYAALAERRKKRQLLVRQKEMERAVAERKSHTGEQE
jgi:NAD-dependent dihydropyrimidine dehydrogenase PreA subunit